MKCLFNYLHLYKTESQGLDPTWVELCFEIKDIRLFSYFSYFILDKKGITIKN